MNSFLNFTAQSNILITGATSVIGKATVIALLRYGVKVIAVGRDEKKFDELRALFPSTKNLFLEKFDLSKNVDSSEKFVSTLVEKYGKISGFVHSAGAIRVSAIKFEDLNEQKKLFDLNYHSGITIIKALANKRHKQESLSCVLLSSIAGINGDIGFTTYSATKGAILSAVKSLAKELGRMNIRVNAVSPGTVKTNISQANPAFLNDDYYVSMKKKWVLPYASSPEKIANLILFLLSDTSSWITGTNIVIDGGESL